MCYDGNCTYFPDFFIEIAFAFDGVRWVVMVVVSGVENQLNICARRDEGELCVAFSAACLEPELALVLWTVAKSCVSYFTVAMQPLEQIVAVKFILLIGHDARHFKNVSGLWRLVELHRIEGNHPSQRWIIHHVHVHHF